MKLSSEQEYRFEQMSRDERDIVLRQAGEELMMDCAFVEAFVDVLRKVISPMFAAWLLNMSVADFLKEGKRLADKADSML